MKASVRTALGAVIAIVVAATCVRLGFWQLHRLEQRRARNAQWERALAQPVMPLDRTTVVAVEADPARFIDRRVRVAGTYDPAGEVVLRGRVHDERPGVHVVTPLRISGTGRAVLVNRGWALSPDGATVDTRPLAEPGERVVEGVFQEVPVTGDGGMPSTSGEARTLSFRRLDLPALRRRYPHPLLPLYVQQLPSVAQAGAPLQRVPVPPLDEGPHLSYAVQWFSFAAIALVGYAVLAWRSRRARSA